MIGSTISHYRITEKLAEGGMGIVYKAEDTRLDRIVALKFLPSESLSEADRQRFVREAQAAARIHHPNVCPIYEIDEENGRLFFAMAYVEGRTIRHLLEQGPLQIDTALDLTQQVANGLEAAHQLGIVHRDIKSSNIVVARHGNACILDFGLALRQDSERITIPGGAVGTPAYMSPEQAQGHSVDHRTDLWSLGVVLFEMVTGRLPFSRDGQFSILYAIVHDPAPTLAGIRAEAPAELEMFLRKALAKDPRQRWQSAAEMAAELRRMRDSHPQNTQTLTTISQIRESPPRWKRAVLAAVMILAISAAGFVGVRRLWPVSGPLPEEKQIAVLPLDVVGNDELTRALADGLVETLTSKLTQIEDFQGRILVVPSSEIRSRKITSAEAARRIYGANLVITGSAQRWGDRIQFTLNLVDAAKLRQIAARTLDFDVAKPIALRDGAIDGVIGLLAIRISPATTGAIAQGETSKPAAYAEYLKGIGYLARYDVSGNISRAVASLKKATQLDPKYALAFAALGEAYWREATDIRSDRHLAALALENVRHAIDLNPKIAIAHVRMGEIYQAAGRVEDAIEEEHRALQIASGSAEAYRVLADAYNSATRYQEAEAAYLEATRQQPSDWSGYVALGFFYYQRGRDADARAAYETALKLTPDNEIVYRNLAALAIREGRYKEASELTTKTLKFEPGPRTYATLGVALYYQGRYEEAASALVSGIDLDPSIYTLWGNLGMVYGHLPGRKTQAQDALRKAVELAEKTLEVTKDDYRTHANLAEYEARLGEREKAHTEIDRIPEAARPSLADRIVLAYELSGERRKALDVVRSMPPQDALISQMKRDPDLQSLWRDPALPR